jgi:hypothetical protein
LEDEWDVKKWLQEATEIMYGLFNSQKTNFNPQAHELYLDLGGFGTGVMYIEDDYAKAPIRFCTYHLGDCVVEEDEYGMVNKLYRKFKLSARQAVAMFGANTPAKIVEMSQTKPATQFEFIHYVGPREKEFEALIPLSQMFDYVSAYVWKDEKAAIQYGKYSEFPYVVPRWSKLTGEVYGRSPAMIAMPDIRMVNAMAKTVIKGAQKIVDPPLQMPDEGFMMPIRMSPGGINYYNSTLNPEFKIEPIVTGGRPDIGFELIESRRQHIIRSFYVDWMQLQEGPQMTATEVQQRTEDKMRNMSPSISRHQSEFLDPVIDRVFNIAMRKQLIEKPPQELEGIQLRVEYVSPVARAQNMTRVMGIQRMLVEIAPLAQLKPEILDRIDPDGYVDILADAYDVDYDMLIPREEAQKARDTREQQAQEAADAQTGQMEADAAQKLAKANESVAKAGQLSLVGRG